MTVYNSKNISSSLLKKGFSEDNRNHKRYDLLLDGKKVGIHTIVSHGTKEYGERLIGEMKKHLHLSKKEFIDFIDCPMTKEEYTMILVERGHIRQNP